MGALFLLPGTPVRATQQARHGKCLWAGLFRGGCGSVCFSSSSSRISCQIKEDELEDFLPGVSKATSVAKSIWKQFVKAGDTVIDATCGNGNDTLLLAKLVSLDSVLGCVYGFDVQQTALDRTSSLLDQELSPEQRNQVQLFNICHSRIQEIVKDIQVRLIVFNLGYLPHGDKNLITRTQTSIKALDAAIELLQAGGLISIIAYVGHPGGREEYEAVKEFACSLPASQWVCSHIEHLNRHGPHLIFLVKKPNVVPSL